MDIVRSAFDWLGNHTAVANAQEAMEVRQVEEWLVHELTCRLDALGAPDARHRRAPAA